MSAWFSFYAQHFDTVELNASFYRFPTPSSVRRWYLQAPEGFVYSVKAPRIITHLKRFKDCEGLLNEFYLVLEKELKEKLGCVLFQLPPSLQAEHELLTRILRLMNPRFKNVIEFRHASWWTPWVYNAMRSNGIAFCSVHAPGLPADLVSTSNHAYHRFHGIPWYAQEYTHDELKAWADRFRQLDAAYVWIYFNNDTAAYAPRNALQLMKMLVQP